MKTMKQRFAGKMQVLSSLVLLLGLFSWTTAYGQITPLGDAYTNTADSTTNYGAKTLLDVDGASQITYIQFNLASIPSGASVSQATLKLYVDAVTKAGSFNVDYVSGAWTESTIDASNAPALGSTIVSSVPITTADKNQYILIDITPAVQAWLSGSQSNDGIALVANSTFNASFDSKENTTTSHPPELDIVFAGDGTITGVTTASGSGLTGGGTSGTLNLSLTNACAANQVLQWNGSAWACAAVGTGTVTSVGSGLGITGGPITGSGTLSIDTSVVPQLAAANTFTASQTVSGNLSATGTVSGSGFQIGSSLFAFGSLANQNAFLGFAGNSTMTGGANTASGWQALINNTTGSDNTASGKHALLNNISGSYNAAAGEAALANNTTGSFNAASGFAALFNSTTGGNDTADGYQALYSNTTGNNNTASGYQVLFYNTVGNSNTANGFQALNNSLGDANTASGYRALWNNTTGTNNTASGIFAGGIFDGSAMTGSTNTFLGAGSAVSTGTLNNATAIGANAEVAASNAMVLGSILGVNNCLASNTPPCASTNVGIGTTTPNAALDVAGNSLQILLGDPVCGSGLAAIGFVVEGGFNSKCNNYAILGTSAGELDINSVESGSINFLNNNIALMVIEPGGKVGIGTGSPDDLLSVNGSADKTGGGSWGTFSDRRLKTLDGSFSTGLSQILKINPVRYRYKEDNGMGIRDHDEHVGLVAQDVQKVIPEAVTENSRGYLLVNNDPIIWTMLNAIKEQQALIRKQQAQIARLGSQVKAIRTSLQTSGRTGSEIQIAKTQVPAGHH